MKRHLTGMNFRLTGYEPPSTVLVVAMPGCEAPSNGHEFSVDGVNQSTVSYLSIVYS